MSVLFKEYKDSPGFIKVDFPVMPTERCAKLMAIGMANNLDEVWISENPMLLATYTRQYFPNLYSWYVLISVKLRKRDQENTANTATYGLRSGKRVRVLSAQSRGVIIFGLGS